MNQTALVVSNSKIRKTYYIYNSGKWNLYFISCYTTMGRFPWRIIIINRRGWVLLSVWSRTTLKEKPEYNNKSYKFQNKFQKKKKSMTNTTMSGSFLALLGNDRSSTVARRGFSRTVPVGLHPPLSTQFPQPLKLCWWKQTKSFIYFCLKLFWSRWWLIALPLPSLFCFSCSHNLHNTKTRHRSNVSYVKIEREIESESTTQKKTTRLFFF